VVVVVVVVGIEDCTHISTCRVQHIYCEVSAARLVKFDKPFFYL